MFSGHLRRHRLDALSITCIQMDERLCVG
jgi:hypothetical protein